MTVYEVRCLNCQKRVSEDRYTHARATRNNFTHAPGCAQKNVKIRSFESEYLRKIQRPSPGTTQQKQAEVQTQ